MNKKKKKNTFDNCSGKKTREIDNEARISKKAEMK